MAPGIELGKLGILCYPDPVLRKTCQPVETFDDELRRLAERMIELMRADKGIGLAAPQVGLDIQMFVCNPTQTQQPEGDLVAINPELSDLTDAYEVREGCLSLPDVEVVVRRAAKATLRAFDLSGKPFERAGKDQEARVWQHETDHLHGRLIIDYMSEAAQIANRRALKQLQAAYKRSA